MTDAKLEAIWPRALRLDPAIRDPIAPHMLLMEAVRRRADEFDVMHFHVDYWPFSLFGRQRTPFVTTLHGRLDLAELQPIFDTFPNAPVVSISDNQRRPLPQARFVQTRSSRLAGRVADAAAEEAGIPCVPGPDCARERAGPCHPHCAGVRHAAQDGGEG